MGDWLVYFGLLDLLLLLLVVMLAAGLIGFALGQRRRRALAELLNALPHGAVIARPDGRVLLANAEARQLWGAGTFPARLEGSWAALALEAGNGEGYSIHNLDAPSGIKLQVQIGRAHV